MTARPTCRKCAAPLVPRLAADFCGACLLQAAVDWWETIPAPTEGVLPGEGERLGPFLLGVRLGEGTFGEVYAATRVGAGGPADAALKILKPGMDTREVVARFAAERETLARLDHPNIVRVLESGTTAQGRPWLAMELVEGEPITEWCDRHRLPIRERLILFEKTCRAVQHAHARGLLHRDLKPANILTATDADGAPMPKLIDFGIAKAVDRAWSGNTAFTLFNRAMGTPQYMAPEQAVPDGGEPDTRSDVYALGAILYELLTGSPPLSDEQLRDRPWGEIVRLIRDERPAAPSAALAAAGPRLDERAACRSTPPARLLRELEGPLDWITLHALEKDPEARYATAAALADEIARHLAGEEVLARPASALDHCLRFLRRHRRAAAAVMAIGLVATAGAWTAGLLYLRARTAETVALQRETEARLAQRSAAALRASADRVEEFIIDVFKAPDASRGGRSLTVAEYLENALAAVETQFAGNPELLLNLLMAMESTERSLDLPTRAKSIPKRMLEVAEALPDPVARARWRDQAAIMLRVRDNRRDAASLHAAVAKELLDLGQVDSPLRLRALTGWAYSVRDYDPLHAAQIQAEVYRLAAARHGEMHESALFALQEEGRCLVLAGAEEEGLGKLQAVVARWKQLRHALGISTGTTFLATALRQTGQPAAALEFIESSLALLHQLPLPEVVEPLELAGQRTEVLAELGRFPEAIAAADEVLAARRRAPQPNQQKVLAAWQTLVGFHQQAGDFAHALRAARELRTAQEQALGPHHQRTLATDVQIAQCLAALGQVEEGERLLRELLAAPEKSGRLRSGTRTRLLLDLAQLTRRYRSAAAALPWYRERLKAVQASTGAQSANTIGATVDLAGALIEAGAAGDADQHLTFAARQLPMLPQQGSLYVFAQRRELAGLLVQRGRLAEARALYDDAIQKLGAEHPTAKKIAALAKAVPAPAAAP